MNRTQTIALALVAAGGVAGASAFNGYAGTASPTPSASPTASSAELSDDAKQDLVFTREEERVSRDLYQHFSDKYDEARPFSNIVNAEARHFESVGILLDRYELTDPAAGKKAGTYANAELQKLYEQWMAQGDSSLAEAYKVGADLERRDIADLKDMANAKLPADVSGLYERLLKGSQNHLAAFTSVTQGTISGQCDGQGLACDGTGPGPGAGQGKKARQGHGQGQGWRGNCPEGGSQQGDCDGAGPRRDGAGMKGNGAGYGRTGERPADCPLAS